MPPAPGWLSTTRRCPSLSPSCWRSRSRVRPKIGTEIRALIRRACFMELLPRCYIFCNRIIRSLPKSRVGDKGSIACPEAAEVLRLLLSYLLKRTFSLSLKPLVSPPTVIDRHVVFGLRCHLNH